MLAYSYYSRNSIYNYIFGIITITNSLVEMYLNCIKASKSFEVEKMFVSSHLHYIVEETSDVDI